MGFGPRFGASECSVWVVGISEREHESVQWTNSKFFPFVTAAYLRSDLA